MNNSRLVYSTKSGKICPNRQKPVSKCTCKKKKSRSQPNIKIDGIIRVQRESKGRKGKTTTTISGFQLDEDELKDLATQLKRSCGMFTIFPSKLIATLRRTCLPWRIWKNDTSSGFWKKTTVTRPRRPRLWESNLVSLWRKLKRYGIEWWFPGH